MNKDTRAELITAIADLQEETALSLVRRRLENGEDPLRVVEDCQAGLMQVGKKYEEGEYFLAGLIMGGEIFRQVMEMVEPVVELQLSAEGSGQILIGTVQGDIHSLGKMILSMLLSCNGFTVHDLGVDVPPAQFVAHIKEISPDVIALSGLLTSSYESMRDTVAAIRQAGVTTPIIIGGGQLRAEVCEYVEADYWTTDAIQGLEICQRLIEKSTT
jgi:methanogenic corrinoid protein MtbC1